MTNKNHQNHQCLVADLWVKLQVPLLQKESPVRVREIWLERRRFGVLFRRVFLFIFGSFQLISIFVTTTLDLFCSFFFDEFLMTSAKQMLTSDRFQGDPVAVAGVMNLLRDDRLRQTLRFSLAGFQRMWRE